MSSPPSSSVAPATFQTPHGKDAISPKQFLDFLSSLVSESLNDEVKVIKEKAEWVVMISGLSEQVYGFFPFLTPAVQETSNERIVLTHFSLDILERVSEKVQFFYDGEVDLVKKLFVTLLGLCLSAESWLEVVIHGAKDNSDPSTLFSRATNMLVRLLRDLLSSCFRGTAEAGWRLALELLGAALDVSQVILRGTHDQFALDLNVFSTPCAVVAPFGDCAQPIPPGTLHTVRIPSAPHLPVLCSIVVDVISRTLLPQDGSQCLTAHVLRRAAETTRSTFEYCLTCPTSAAVRSRCLGRVAEAAHVFTRNVRSFRGVLGDLPTLLLLRKLQEGPKTQSALSLRTLTSFALHDKDDGIQLTASHAHMMLGVLAKQDWQEAGVELRNIASAFLRKHLSQLDSQTLQVIRDFFQGNTSYENWKLLVDDATTIQHGEAVNQSMPTRPAGWRVEAWEELKMVLDAEHSWMDIDEELSDVLYARRGLDAVKGRLERTSQDTPASIRVACANYITSLATHLPPSLEEEASLCSLSALFPLLEVLVVGSAELVTPLVRRKTYSSLSVVLKHHGGDLLVNDNTAVVKFIQRGLSDKERTTRLSAGRVLAQLVRLYTSAPGGSWRQGEHFCFLLSGILEAFKKYAIKETTLITLGYIGRDTHVEIQGHIVATLISQLGEENPLLRSVAHGELLALAKFHGKGPYGLVSPFLARIAPFVVARKHIKPFLLAETCRFMGVLTSDFLSVTLPKTLPHLFANCEMKVLEEMSSELGQKPSTLFMNHCHRILAEVFRLQGPGQTNKSLAFILKILSEAAVGSKATIDLQSIVKSCLFPLLAELVVVSGDENEDQAASATNALKKVARTMSSAGGDHTLPNVDLAVFLKTHMLGVVSNINELLQDVYGKKTLSDKRQILRGLGALIVHIGDAVHNVAPQIMATLQTMFLIPELSEVALSTWYTFLVTLAAQDVGPHIGATAASLVSLWTSLSTTGRETARRCLNFIVFDLGDVSGEHLDDMADLGNIPELLDAHNELKRRRANWAPRERLQKILERLTSDNFTVALQSLEELKAFMSITHADFVRGLASGDTFDALVGRVQSSLFHIASRDGDGSERLRLLAFECMGILGAVDPDRCEFGLSDSRMVVRSNFTDEAESVLFAMHFIKDVLVGAFRSTSDIKYQGQLAYTIQELLKFCNFTPALVSSRNTTSVPVKVRNRWNSLPKYVLETVTPLLEARFGAPERMPSQLSHPIYPRQNTYREWLQLWTAHLITRASGQTAQRIFGVFRMAVRNKDVGVALHLLPHVVLNILLSGDEKDVQDILNELLAVLEDQVSHDSRSNTDKKLLSAQVVFMLFDHLSKYVRILRQDIGSKKAEANNKRSRVHHALAESEEQLVRVDSLLSSINHDLMAKAALQCKAYARSLMNFERQIVALRERETHTPDNQLTPYYERLHEIYAHLDEPDGMEGISMLILSPSLEHQIRQHESTGQWTSAQSCWEVRLQQSPDNLEFHLGLLRCLRNLGHYDTLRTHVQGVLLRNPDWESALVGFQAESAWMISAWDDLQRITSKCELSSPSVMKARVLLAMRSGDSSAVTEALSKARAVLGAPIAASGVKGHRRSYDALLDLHMVHELEMIHAAIPKNPPRSQSRRAAIKSLRTMLTDRLESTLPNFRIRGSVLSMRRTAFALSSVSSPSITSEIGRSWLASAKIARKAKQWQTAYSATLQAQQSNAPFHFMESAKLVKATGEPLRALQELENSMRLSGIMTDQDTIDLTTEDDAEFKRMRAKAHILLARWMNESGRYEPNRLLKAFSTAANQGTMLESAYYHLGRFHDQCFKLLPSNDDERAIRMNAHTVRDYGKAMLYGSKYVYQAIPRMLTLWLDLGENAKTASHPIFAKINSAVATAIESISVYKWFTAFPQIVSRVGHDNEKVYALLSKLISKVIREYPHQALWLFASVVKSTKSNRGSRGRAILDALKNDVVNERSGLPALILQSQSMTDELLRLCNHPINEEHKALSMKREFPKLAALGRSRLLIPLQESLTANLPPASSTENSTHVPFPTAAPTFEEFSDEIEVMKSLAKPRKITIRGSNGQTYVFLGKPKDDLRKDARLMDFNAIINKLLKADSESRRRQLRIRTYGVVTLNEECGFIQWVPNTIPVRPVLLKYYEAKRIRSWSSELSEVFRRIKDASDKDAAELFVTKVLPVFPPVFHEWFVETFPEPTAWLASRLTYGRTAAVMSMVGFILGLGDRHCENILLDTNTGDVVHVDLNCLFEKGKTFEIPERVPFRLTQNMIDGLGVTGVEGVFRIACEVTMQLLRVNKDSLMSVLDAFIHDPLVEWEDEKRKIDRERRNAVKSSTDLRHLAKNALRPIERKLRGVYSPSNMKARTHGGGSTGDEREISTSNLVQMLIQEAVDEANLAKMYPGWAAWH